MYIDNIKVEEGMFCQYGGCSIWFEILHVYDGALSVSSRNPSKQTEYIGNYHINSPMFKLSKELPTGNWITGHGKGRKKNFYDKFYPELNKIIVSKQKFVYSQHRERVKKGTHSPVNGF